MFALFNKSIFISYFKTSSSYFQNPLVLRLIIHDILDSASILLVVEFIVNSSILKYNFLSLDQTSILERIMLLLQESSDEVKITIKGEILDELIAIAKIRVDVDFRFGIRLGSHLNELS